MPSTYTLNNGIELIATGEQSGTWGDTTNTNLELLDAALDGQVTVTLTTAGTSGSPNTLAISDGAASDGRNRMVIFDDGGDLGATAYVQLTPNDAEKIIYVRNDLAGSRSIILFQGTYNASNDYELPAGTTAVIYFDGAGSGAVAANVFNNAYFDSLRLGSVSVTEIIDDDTMATAAATNIATSESIKAYVDAQVGANNELSEVLANGNTSGGTGLIMSSGDDLTLTGASYNVTWDSSDNLMRFASNASAIFGGSATDYLQIYSDGTNKYIQDTGSGSLFIRGSDLILEDAGGNDYIAMSDTGTGGTVELKHSATTRLTTSSSGVDISGNILRMDGTSPMIYLMEAGVTDSNHRIRQNTGNLYFQKLSDDTNTATDRMSIDGGTGDIVFYDASGNASFVYDESAGSTFNEQGDNKDFRVESDSDNSAFFVDASANKIGMGTGSPINNLHIDSTGSTSVRISGDTGNSSVFGEYSGATDGESLMRVFGYQGSTFYGTMDIRRRLSNEGQIVHRFRTNSANRDMNIFDGVESVFNEDSQDTDFRVESSGNTHQLFVDAALNRVGIGDSAPTDKLTMTFSTNNSSLIDTGGVTANAAGGMKIINTADTNGNFAGTFYRVGNADAKIAVVKTDSNRAAMRFFIDKGGIQQQLALADGENVFNEGSADQDFRVESNNNTHMLFVDAGNDNIGIDTSNPVATLVVSNGGASGIEFQPEISTNFNRITNFNRSASVYNELGIDAERIEIRPEGVRRLSVATSGVIVNEDSRSDTDFRVEGDSDTHVLFVDASTDRVGISTSAPPVQFTVGGNDGTAEMMLWGNNANSTSCRLIFGAQSPYTNEFIQFRYDSDNNDLYLETDTTFGVGEIASFDRQYGTIVFNEQGLTSQDFRVESDTTTHMLFVDSSAEAVIIGDNNKSTSDSGLSVVGTAIDNISIQYKGTSGGHLSKFNFVDKRDQVNARINNNLINDGTGTQQAHLEFHTAYDGTLYERFILSRTEAVLNDDSQDVDFRVESDSSTHMLFVDAGNSAVLMGASTAASGGFNSTTKFVMNGTSSYVLGLRTTNNTSTGLALVDFRDGDDQRMGLITGNASANTVTYGTSSDRSLKENDRPIPNPVDRVKSLNPVLFDWISDGTSSEGFIAQELEQDTQLGIDAVAGEDGEKNVDYGRLTPLLTAALQEALTKIETLEARITALENA